MLGQFGLVDAQTKARPRGEMKETPLRLGWIFEYAVLARRGIVELARLGGVQLARHQMHVRHMADRRLRLMRDQLDAMRIRQCNAPRQPGDPAHLDNVRLHHADPGRNKISKARQGVGLFAGRDRDIEPLSDLAHRLQVVVLHRLLEPPIAEILQRSADADRTANRIAVIGIEGEREAVADQSPHRARLGDVARNVDVGLGPIIVEPDFYGRGLVFEPGFDHSQDIVDAALAIAADRGVERQTSAPSAAEKLIDRLIEQLPFEVPQCDVECRESAGQRALRPELGERTPPCIGEASPIPEEPSSQWIRTQALRCSGLSPGAQPT